MGRYPWAMRAGGPLLGGGGSTDFISEWKTDNIGTSANDQITLPLDASGSYDFEVDWGDGSTPDTITAFNDPAVTHTFLGGAGTFIVTITGEIDGWEFNNGGDAQKLIGVSNWGTLEPGASTVGQFYGCSNLVVTATDILDTSSVTSMASMFRDCASLTALDLSGFDTSAVTNISFMFQNCSSLTTLNISGFDTSAVTNMGSMFRNCSSLAVLDVSGFDTAAVTIMSSTFRQCTGLSTLALDQSGWDVGLVATMSSFCEGVTLNTANYDSILAAWAAQTLQSAVPCDFGSSQYTIATAQADRDILTDPPNSWTLTDGGGI